MAFTPQRPSRVFYNDLNGEEVKHILEQRFHSLLEDVVYLQRHITLPRLRMSLEISFEVWADQPKPELYELTDAFEIASETAPPPTPPTDAFYLEDSVNAADRTPGGKPPDQVREEHQVGIPTPTKTVFAGAIEDVIEGKRIELETGAIIDRTGNEPRTGRQNSTVVIQDFGPAGLARNQMNRPQVEYGNRSRRDGEPIAKPRIGKE